MWEAYAVNVMKFMADCCGPVNSVKWTKSLGLFCLRSLPCVSREKKLQKRPFPLLCQLSPLLWGIPGLVISGDSVRVGVFLRRLSTSVL